MKGIPKILSTKKDWLNMYEYAIKKGSDTYKMELKIRLKGLKDTGSVLVLKKGIIVPPEEQKNTDFKLIADKGSTLSRTGFTIPEIDLMISKLS